MASEAGIFRNQQEASQVHKFVIEDIFAITLAGLAGFLSQQKHSSRALLLTWNTSSSTCRHLDVVAPAAQLS